MTTIRIVYLFFLVSFLVGCSLISPVKIKSQPNYVLNSVPQAPSSRHITKLLLVNFPDTLPAYNTPNMAYSLRPYQISYFSRNQWVATPGQMLHPLIVQSLRQTHYYRAVVTPPYTGPYHYILSTQILSLVQDYTTFIPTIRLQVHAQLSKMPSNKILANKEFYIVKPFQRCNLYAGVRAANSAVYEFLEQLNEFCIHNSK